MRSRSGGGCRRFVFGTRLTNVTRQLRLKDPDEALESCSDAVKDWSGGTRIASAPARLQPRLVAPRARAGRDRASHHRRAGARGQGRSPASTSQREMDRLHRSCRRLIWLNPLLRYEGFAAQGARRAPDAALCRRVPPGAFARRDRRSREGAGDTARAAAPIRAAGSTRPEEDGAMTAREALRSFCHGGGQAAAFTAGRSASTARSMASPSPPGWSAPSRCSSSPSRHGGAQDIAAVAIYSAGLLAMLGCSCAYNLGRFTPPRRLAEASRQFGDLPDDRRHLHALHRARSARAPGAGA